MAIEIEKLKTIKLYTEDGEEIGSGEELLSTVETNLKPKFELGQKEKEELEVLRKKDFDFGRMEKKFKDLTEEEKTKLGAEKLKEMQEKEALQDKLNSIERDRENDLIEANASVYINLEDEETKKQFETNYKRVALTDEEQKLPLKERVKIKVQLACRLIDTPRKDTVLNGAFGGVGMSGASARSERQNRNSDDNGFADSEAGEAMLRRMGKGAMLDKNKK